MDHFAKGELQQDFRAAANLLQHDISMAGAGAMGQQGLAYNAVGLPSTATKPVYPCSTTTCNYIKAAPVTYPTAGGAPYIYSIIPGPSVGITVSAGSGPTDIISLVIADVNLELNCYTINVTSGTTANFGLPSPLPPTCILPTGVLEPPALVWSLTNPAGLQAGDMVMFGTNNAVGVVTNVVGGTASASCFTPAASVNPPITYSIPGETVTRSRLPTKSAQLPTPAILTSPILLREFLIHTLARLRYPQCASS